MDPTEGQEWSPGEGQRAWRATASSIQRVVGGLEAVERERLAERRNRVHLADDTPVVDSQLGGSVGDQWRALQGPPVDSRSAPRLERVPRYCLEPTCLACTGHAIEPAREDIRCCALRRLAAAWDQDGSRWRALHARAGLDAADESDINPGLWRAMTDLEKG